MILGQKAILELIKTGEIKITPYNKCNVGPASIDLTLGNEFRFFETGVKTVKISENTRLDHITKRRTTNKGYIELKPGDLVLGITKETIKLPENIGGWLGGRTRFARLGLAIHVTSAFVQPGSNNKQVLEIKNVSNYRQLVKPGLKICQIFLEEIKDGITYTGKYSKQKKI